MSLACCGLHGALWFASPCAIWLVWLCAGNTSNAPSLATCLWGVLVSRWRWQGSLLVCSRCRDERRGASSVQGISVVRFLGIVRIRRPLLAGLLLGVTFVACWVSQPSLGSIGPFSVQYLSSAASGTWSLSDRFACRFSSLLVCMVFGSLGASRYKGFALPGRPLRLANAQFVELGVLLGGSLVCVGIRRDGCVGLRLSSMPYARGPLVHLASYTATGMWLRTRWACVHICGGCLESLL